MEKEKLLKVTAKYGSLDFSETARPYNENVHDDQLESCLKSITQQIKDAGRTEMTEAFAVEGKIVEE